MGYIEGRKVFMLIDKGTGYVLALCATSITYSTTTETKQIMTVGDGVWRKPKQQEMGYNISLEGITADILDPLDRYDTFNFIDSQMGFTNIAYRIYFQTTDVLGASVIKMVQGEALVTESNLTAGAEGTMDTSLTLEGFGAPEWFDTTSACNATISSLSYSAQGALFVDINYFGLAGASKLSYSVDGSTRRTLLAMPANGTIVITNGVGMNPGLHTIQVWPVCDNGEDGTSLSTNYTKT